MKALEFQRSIPRYAAARVAGSITPGSGAKVGPLKLVERDHPAPPAQGWQRVRPRLSGICGSDLATIDGRASRYFEHVVSFPFVPGHEVVGDLDDGTRVVIEPVLACATRGIDPPCRACARGHTDRCERLAFGHLEPGLQIGYCTDTGGGWAESLMAHESQIHPVPDALDDESAVMIEPTACAVHGALATDASGVVVVLGCGTLGLCTIAALRRLATPSAVVAVAKHPEQRRLATELGSDLTVAPGEAVRAVRRTTGSLQIGSHLSGGADVVVDCLGSSSSLAESLRLVRPGGSVVMVGMPATVTVDLTSLWQRQVRILGSYAYGSEDQPAGPARTFDLAADLVATADLGRLVSALYPLANYREAIDHAANAGRRGAVKVAFDLRGEKRR